MLKDKEKESEGMMEDYEQAKSEIEKLKLERDTLIDISNNLKSSLNQLREKYEDRGGLGDNPEYARVLAQNEVAYERI